MLFPSRAKYADEVLPARITYFTQLFNEYRPAYVFGYGESYWPYYEQIVGVTEFEELEATKMAVAVSGRSRNVLTQFFSRYFMSDDRVEALVQRLASM